MRSRWFFVSLIVIVLIILSGCRLCELTGSCRDVTEVHTSGGVYVFELAYVRFEYDTNNGLMRIINLTSLHVSGRIVRWDDEGEARIGVTFNLPNYHSEKSYHEDYERGTELKINIDRDNIKSETYVILQ